MRYVFLDPPFWGDTLAVFANIWLVLMAFSLAVYDREHIAMQGMYDSLPRGVAVSLRLVWDVAILAMGVFMLVYGLVLVDNIRGSYHELAGLPKKWPVTILPVFGFLTIFAVLEPIVTDIKRLFNRKDTDEGDEH
jgi:TRAP-type C4-dicarboxylate transport system permease small subunit